MFSSFLDAAQHTCVFRAAWGCAIQIYALSLWDVPSMNCNCVFLTEVQLQPLQPGSLHFSSSIASTNDPVICLSISCSVFCSISFSILGTQNTLRPRHPKPQKTELEGHVRRLQKVVLRGPLGTYGRDDNLLVLSRECGNILYRDCIGIMFSFSLLRTSKISRFKV